MKIESSEFGKIVVDGKEMTEDVIIIGEKMVSWWRKQGHIVIPDDLELVIKEKPKTLVIGTGHSGMMTVTKEALDLLIQNQIKFIISDTDEAVKIFNESDVACALHLTC